MSHSLAAPPPLNRAGPTLGLQLQFTSTEGFVCLFVHNYYLLVLVLPDTLYGSLLAEVHSQISTQRLCTKVAKYMFFFHLTDCCIIHVYIFPLFYFTVLKNVTLSGKLLV